MRVVILGSGLGRNAEAILKAQKTGGLGKAEVVAVLADHEDARILRIAEENGIEAFFINPGQFKTKLEGPAEQHYIDFITSMNPDLIVFAGFMRVVKKNFLEAFANKLINLHPSLLPAFKGLNAIKQALDYGSKYSGCTVHWVTEGLDEGQIIDQAAVRIEEGESLESLEARVHEAECRLLPSVIKRFSEKN